MVKPRFFGSQESFDESPEHEGFLVLREQGADTMVGRFPAGEFRLRLENPRQFVDENIELSLKVLWFSYRGATTGTANSA